VFLLVRCDRVDGVALAERRVDGRAMAAGAGEYCDGFIRESYFGVVRYYTGDGVLKENERWNLSALSVVISLLQLLLTTLFV